MADEDEAALAHLPFHVAVRVPPPRCATDGLPPRLTNGTGADGDGGGSLVVDETDETLAVRKDGRPVSTTT